MSFSSISDLNSLQQSQENVKRCQKEKTKRKKIRKNKKKRSRMHVVSQGNQNKNIYEFLSHRGQEYLESKLNELLEKYNSLYRSTVHIKNILGQDQNVYNIKNYESCEKMAKEYLDLINLLEGAKLQKMSLVNSEAKIVVDFIQLKKREEQKRKRLCLLDKTQTFLLSRRKEVIKEIDEFLDRLTNQLKENQHFNRIDKEILTLCKLNTVQQASVMDFFNRIAISQSNDNLFNVHLQPLQSENSHIDEYISLLIKKNLRKTFDENPIDLLNYFKITENNERNVHDDIPLKRLSNKTELVGYLKNKKHKFGKSQQNSLKTCCSGCFSNYYQIYNPIETCTECGMRMHKYCQKMKSKCQRCKYIRKTIEEKSQTHFCIICKRDNQKGLLIQSCIKEGKEEYVHTFCLLVHQQWKIQGETLIENWQEEEQTVSQCKFCQKESQYSLQCSCCKKSVHGMCAFLQGCSFSFSDSDKTLVSCCNSKLDQDRLSFERKFKLNFQKLLYKKGSQFYSIIQTS